MTGPDEIAQLREQLDAVSARLAAVETTLRAHRARPASYPRVGWLGPRERQHGLAPDVRTDARGPFVA